MALDAPTTRHLTRVVGLPGAVLLGLGSIVGTGLFVSIGVAADVAGPAVAMAVLLGAVVATFNGLASAELAAAHPVSGGTYEYGHRWLGPGFGFAAGWLFLCAKSASAATAALGFSGYVLTTFGVTSRGAQIGLGVLVVALVTALLDRGMRRTNHANALLIGLTLLGLLIFVVAGAPAALRGGVHDLGAFFQPGSWRDLLHATALMFVAYTGYGRVATLGEEVRDPHQTIPRAVLLTLVITAVLYVVVVLMALRLIGAPALASATREGAAPLEAAAATLWPPQVRHVVTAAAVTAMAGVLLNLVLGLSRVLLAMGRRGELPGWVGEVDVTGAPRRAVWIMGATVATLTCLGSVRTTWSFSAFSVLVYYAITNLAALRLPREHRRYPWVVPACGLVSCLGLAFWIDRTVWLSGIIVLTAGFAIRALALRRRR